jgi:hypothetical protein
VSHYESSRGGRVILPSLRRPPTRSWAGTVAGVTLEELAGRVREFAAARVKLEESERLYDVESYRGSARKAPPLS